MKNEHDWNSQGRGKIKPFRTVWSPNWNWNYIFIFSTKQATNCSLHWCYRDFNKIELKTPSEWAKCSCHLYSVTVIHQGIKVKAALLVITESFEMICGKENRRLWVCCKWLDLSPIFVSICLTDMRMKAFCRVLFKSML